MAAFQASAVSRRYAASAGSCEIREIRGAEQRGDLDGQRERRVARLLLPAILLRDRPVAREESRRAAHHRPEERELGRVERTLSVREVHQQDREPGFVHLDAVPVRRAIEPHVLRPVPVGFLRDREVAKHPLDVVARTGGEQAARALDEITRPHEVIAAEVAVALGEAPRDREAGDDAAGESLRLVRTQDGGGHAVQVAHLA